jgi:hypothetical protein
MNQRPRSVTVIGWLFIVMGSVALLYHLSDFNAQHPFDIGLLWVCFVRVVAVAAGALVLRGFNWARWLLVLWMAYHIVLSAFHAPIELAMHVLLFGMIGYFLFRPEASAYFRRQR